MVSLRHVLCFDDFLYRRAVDTVFPGNGYADWHFDKEFEVHYDIDNKNYYILEDGKKFADIEVKRTTFFKIIYAHYYWTVLLDD